MLALCAVAGQATASVISWDSCYSLLTITALILTAWIGVSSLPADLMDKTDGPCKDKKKPL
jgi:hypothetical protein